MKPTTSSAAFAVAVGLLLEERYVSRSEPLLPGRAATPYLSEKWRGDAPWRWKMTWPNSPNRTHHCPRCSARRSSPVGGSQRGHRQPGQGHLSSICHQIVITLATAHEAVHDDRVSSLTSTVRGLEASRPLPPGRTDNLIMRPSAVTTLQFPPGSASPERTTSPCRTTPGHRRECPSQSGALPCRAT